MTDLRMDKPDVKGAGTPTTMDVLKRHQDSQDFDESFKYRAVIGKIGYLEKVTRLELAYANHQCVRYTTCAKQEHGRAVRRIGRYIKETLGKGIVFQPDTA